LWGFLAAEAISFVGNKTTMVALPWLVLTTTGSLTKVGVVAFAQTGCYVLVRGLGGPVIDRLGRRRGAYLQSIREGLRYVRGDRLLLAICLLLWCTNLFDQALFAVFIPSWIKDTADDPTVLGTIAGAFGLGSAIGAFGYAWLAPRMSRYLTFSVGMLLAGPASFFVLGLTDGLLGVLAAFFLSGIASGPINPILSSAMFERVPKPMHARVFGFTGSLAWAGIPVGSLYGGLLADSAGLREALVITAVLYLVITLSPLLIRTPWRGLDRAEPAYSGTQ
jgi:MFS family permease